MNLDQLLKYCDQYPDDALLHFSVGNKFYEMGEAHYDDAIFYLEKAVILDNKHIATLYILGSIYADLAKFDKARTIFMQALEIMPELGPNEGQDLEPAIREALENLEY